MYFTFLFENLENILVYDIDLTTVLVRKCTIDLIKVSKNLKTFLNNVLCINNKKKLKDIKDNIDSFDYVNVKFSKKRFLKIMKKLYDVNVISAFYI